MSNRNLANMTEMEVAKLAQEMGIAIAATTTKQELIAAITLMEKAKTSQVESTNTVTATPVAETTTKPKSKNYRLIVQNQEGVDNTPYIVVGVNGKVWQIPRDTEVTVPESVVNTLREAVMTLLEQQRDEQGRNIVVERKAPRFPFHVLGEAA